MKKIKAMILALAAAGASLSTYGISGSAEDRLVITRDDSGNVTIGPSDNEDTPFGGLLQTQAIKLSKGDHGEILCSYSYLESMFSYFITDSSGFQREFVERPWIRNVDNWMKWEEITPDQVTEYFEDDNFAGYKEGYADWMEQYGGDARVYRLRYSNSATDAKIMARETDLNYDSVLDVVYLQSELTGTACWNGDFTLVFCEDYDGFYTENGVNYAALPRELCDYLNEQEALYEEWNNAYQNWMDSIDADSMTPAQLEVSREEAGVVSDYEMLQRASEVCETILTEYSDIFQSGKPDYTLRSWKEVVYPVSTWEIAGDLDEDGTPSAADAALLLEAAAYQGAGDANDFLSSYQLEAADVNADYAYNAEDAALILAYAAERGAGNDISFKELVKLSTSES